MSDSTNTIDGKKDELNSKTGGLASNIGKFLYSVFSLIILFVIYFVLSGLVLYGCKIGQSNILPTNKDCFPYNETKPNIEDIPINIFTTFSDPPLSMKINLRFLQI